MLRFARLIFGGGTSQSRGDDALIDAAIEKVVDACDPRLRVVSGYKNKLRDATGKAVKHVTALTELLGPSLDVSPQLFATDPRVRAYFGSSGQISEVFGDSRPVRDFLARPESVSLQHLYGSMRMELDEKRVLTSELHGETILRDVLRTAMNFGHHHVGLVAADDKTLRQEIEERAFVLLIECALEKMAAEKHRKSELEEQRTLLRSKLQFLKARELGMEPLLERDRGPGTSIAKIEKSLEKVEAELTRTVPRTAFLRRQIELLNDVMNHPRDYLNLERKSVHITRMGMKADPESPEPAHRIEYTKFTLGDKTWVGELVRYPVNAVPPRRRLADLTAY